MFGGGGITLSTSFPQQPTDINRTDEHQPHFKCCISLNFLLKGYSFLMDLETRNSQTRNSLALLVVGACHMSTWSQEACIRNFIAHAYASQDDMYSFSVSNSHQPFLVEIRIILFDLSCIKYEIVVATSPLICKKGFAPHTGARAIPPT